MEPRNEEHQRQEGATDLPLKRRRFRIVKLEERIAPGGGMSKGKGCGTHNCTNQSVIGSSESSGFPTVGCCLI